MGFEFPNVRKNETSREYKKRVESLFRKQLVERVEKLKSSFVKRHSYSRLNIVDINGIERYYKIRDDRRVLYSRIARNRYIKIGSKAQIEREEQAEIDEHEEQIRREMEGEGEEALEIAVYGLWKTRDKKGRQRSHVVEFSVFAPSRTRLTSVRKVVKELGLLKVFHQKGEKVRALVAGRRVVVSSQQIDRGWKKTITKRIG